MIHHLVNEGVLTYGTLCGVFTSHLLMSLKSNLIDPLSNKLLPRHIFEHDKDNVQENLESTDHINVMMNYHKQSRTIKWKLFLRDLIVWFITVYIMYAVWKIISNKIRISEQKINL